MTEWTRPMAGLDEAAALAWADPGAVSENANRLFSQGSRPVIRWIKGAGLDDVITRTAIAEATRLFGRTVDYCLCTNGLDAARAREILAWASQPVHWRPVDVADNVELAALLRAAGCPRRRIGYWWKWFPERVRPEAPEWILDGDMVVVDRPAWFEAWASGKDVLRVSDGDVYWRHDRAHYGRFADLVPPDCQLYSGLVSLPPGQRYMPEIVRLLEQRPLGPDHDGIADMSEQGVVAAAFARLSATPVPLADFPFARAFEERLDFGFNQPAGRVWGYHFGNAFRRENHHFARKVDAGELYWRDDSPSAQERHAWLQNWGQWGRPGWSMNPICVERIAALAEVYAGRPMLELGTSRGFLTAVLAAKSGIVTTVDREDRGAAAALRGLDVVAVVADAVDFLRRTTMRYAFITVDLHGNDEATWATLWPELRLRAAPGGTLVLYNSHLWEMPEWREETGLRWLLDASPEGFRKQIFPRPLPGMIVLTVSDASEREATQIAAHAAAPVRPPEKRPQAAVAALEKALATTPEDFRLYDVLCAAYEHLGNTVAALEAARRMVALAPHHPGFRERLARLWLAAGDLDNAETEVRSVLDVAPDRAWAHHLLSLVLLRSKRVGEALAEAQAAVRLDAGRSGLQHHLGGVALQAGDLPEAERAARAVTTLAPGNPDGFLLLSRVLDRRGQPAAAQEAIAEALKLAPTRAVYQEWATRLSARAASS